MKAAKLACPGNNLTLFRRNPVNVQKLDNLVDQLKETCSTKYYREGEIQLHIINSLADRRRHIKDDDDHEKVV